MQGAEVVRCCQQLIHDWERRVPGTTYLLCALWRLDTLIISHWHSPFHPISTLLHAVLTFIDMWICTFCRLYFATTYSLFLLGNVKFFSYNCLDGATGGHHIRSVHSVVVTVVHSSFYTGGERGEPRIAVALLCPGIELSHVEAEPFVYIPYEVEGIHVTETDLPVCKYQKYFKGGDRYSLFK